MFPSHINTLINIQSSSQSVSQSVSQKASQSMSQSVSQPVSLAVSQSQSLNCDLVLPVNMHIFYSPESCKSRAKSVSFNFDEYKFYEMIARNRMNSDTPQHASSLPIIVKQLRLPSLSKLLACHSSREVARAFNTSRQSIDQLRQRCAASCDVKTLPRSGRPRCTI